MCDKLPYCNPRIDNCMKGIIRKINLLPNYKTLASCCGHGVYNATIVMKNRKGDIFEFFSKEKLEFKKRNRYYKKDKLGFYYIPQITQKQKLIEDFIKIKENILLAMGERYGKTAKGLEHLRNHFEDAIETLKTQSKEN